MASPPSFFQKTPAGKILNRFSQGELFGPRRREESRGSRLEAYVLSLIFLSQISSEPTCELQLLIDFKHIRI